MHDNDEKAIAEYHKRRQKYIDLGFNQYETMEYLVDLMEPIDGTVLEVGTGRGLTAITIARHALLTSVDIDAEAIDFARKLAESEGLSNRIEFIERDITTDPFPTDSFDYVFSTIAFHHYDDPVKMINLLCSITRKKLLVADFNDNGFNIVDKMHKNEGHEEHGRGKLDISVAGDVMHQNGFTVERFENDVVITYIGTKLSL
ncbi:MAG: class I SAM-dependent methyltransferase [Acidobacteria bacterium]|nr:class I SAM-dependent methyltransferase [Acidobacteriota bacterium]